jgi:hypothetical protein
MTRKSSVNDEQLIASIQELYGSEITSGDLKGFCASRSLNYQTVSRRLEQYKTARGRWNLEVTQDRVEEIERSYQAPAALPTIEQNLIPDKDDTFVKFGNFGDIKKIIQSHIFYPAFITGLSGNGKTFSVEQACAQLKRELIRVNITIETDEDDLIGGFRLVNGETAWHNGPVVEALERGAVRYVKPADGFNVIATANTKGKGSDDGRFIGTNVLNEAFLERFPVTFEQSYPAPATEQKILEGIALDLGVEDRDFCKRLVDWADIIRKTFYDGGIEEIISTRRLVHIIRAYSIFQDKAKAIQVCVNRFDDETKQSFLELYDKVDADFQMPVDQQAQS